MKKKILAVLVSGLILVGLSTATYADVLTFDDFSTTTSVELLASAGTGYGGFNWVNFGVTYNQYVPGSGYDLGTVSGDYVAAGWGSTAEIKNFDSSFDFIRAYFTSAYVLTNDLTITGFASGAQIYSDTITINNNGPLWFYADWTGVDSLSFEFSGQQIAMDDFTFQLSSSVPIPGTILLLGAGLVGLVGLRKKSKK